jgi:hypothetical protein
MSGSGNVLIWYAAWVTLGVLGLAVTIEILRRARDRRRRRAAEWQTVEAIAREKELSQEELEILRGMLHRRCPGAPLRAITVRQQFDRCVEDEIAALTAAKDTRALERQGELLRDIRVRLGLDYVPYGQRIHSTSELYRGQAVWAADQTGADLKWRRLNVTAVDEACFHLAPSGDEPLPALRPGDSVQCRMWREEDARYAFSVVLTRSSEEPPEWLFRHTADLQRTQSRAHFRIRYEPGVSLGIVNAPVDGDMTDVAERPVVARLRGRFISLSGGGFAVMVDQPMPRQVLLRATLELDPETPPVDVTARIVTTAPLSAGRYLVRAAFAGMSDELRDQVTHFVFHKQQPVKAVEAEAGPRPE